MKNWELIRWIFFYDSLLKSIKDEIFSIMLFTTWKNWITLIKILNIMY